MKVAEPQRRPAGERQGILIEMTRDLCLVTLPGLALVGNYLAGLTVQLLPAPPMVPEAEEEVERQAAQLCDLEPGPGDWSRSLTEEGVFTKDTDAPVYYFDLEHGENYDIYFSLCYWHCVGGPPGSTIDGGGTSVGGAQWPIQGRC